MPAKRKQSSLSKTKSTTTYAHGGPMQHFREMQESRKKEMLSNSLPKAQKNVGDSVQSNKKEARKHKRDIKKDIRKWKKETNYKKDLNIIGNVGKYGTLGGFALHAYLAAKKKIQKR